MKKTAVLCAVGLTPDLVGEHTPRLAAFARRGAAVPVGGVTPAVTTTVQTTYLTGATPAEHGVVGNGWLFRDTAEVRFWQQSDALVQAPRLWDRVRALPGADGFTVANMFWWFNMYSSVDWAVTPRPMYPADGRKLPDVHTSPGHLRHELQAELGQFPLFRFWGPAASIESTRWIADATRRLDVREDPTLSLVYLPHLDYCLQKHGPDPAAVARELGELDAVCGELIDHFEERGANVVVLSEYGIVPVSRPVHLNRALRAHGLLELREELGRELLDVGASAAFAVADHQIAHVHVRDAARVDEVRALLEAVPGVGEVHGEEGKRELGLDHERAGELVCVAEADAWFTYYFWEDDARAPDYARTVDIHRKPGYDPVELFVDPAIRSPKVAIGRRVLRSKLGIRGLMDVIPLDAGLVRGSHGRVPDRAGAGPLLMTNAPDLLTDAPLEATGVHDVLLRHVGVGAPVGLA